MLRKGAILACLVICCGALVHHEDLKHHHQIKSARHNVHNIHQRQHLHRRDNLNGSSDPNGLDFYYSSNRSLLGFLNSTSGYAAIFNYSSTLFLILNGKNGEGLGVDTRTQSTVKLNSSWSENRESFEAYFQSLSSLQSLISAGQSVERHTDLFHEAPGQLGVQEGNLADVSQALYLLRGTINALISGEGHYRIHGGITHFVNVLLGITDLFHDAPAGTLAGAHLDLQSIINASNGLQALLRILQSTRNLNWGQIAGRIFTDPERFLRIIVELGGNDNSIDNLFKVIYYIVAISRGREYFDNLFQVLLEIGQNGGIAINGSDLSQIIDEFLKLAEGENSGTFRVFIQFLRDLNANNLFLNSINFSTFLQLLRTGNSRGAIDLVVRFLVLLNNIFNPAQSIPRFFGFLLRLLNSSRGLQDFPNLLPGIDIGQIQQFLQSGNLEELLQNQDAISQIPGIGQIYQLISQSLGNASNGSLDFLSLLTAGWQQIVQSSLVIPNLVAELLLPGGGGFSTVLPFPNFAITGNITILSDEEKSKKKARHLHHKLHRKVHAAHKHHTIEHGEKERNKHTF